MPLYRMLSASAQAAYSEVYQATVLAEVRRSIASLPGTLQSKVVKGRVYWYYAFRDAVNGKLRQLYIGPESPALEILRQQSAHPPKNNLRELAAAALVHGCMPVIAKHFRIIRQLADTRFFNAGGLLVGSHAFIAIGNLLGVRWEDGTGTLDIDLATAGPSPNIAVALPADIDIDVHSAIESLQMGFLPALGQRGRPTGSYVSESDPGLRLDFLTPLRRSTDVVVAPALNIALQPLKFLDYLIEGPTQAALLSAQQGAVVVNVPDPARFALHKLVIAGERPAAEQLKSRKDIGQASAIIEFLMVESPDALAIAHQDLQQRGPGWRRRFDAALRKMQRTHPAIAQHFATVSPPAPQSSRRRPNARRRSGP